MSDYLTKPLSLKEIEAQQLANGFISGNVICELDDILNEDMKTFPQYLSTKLTAFNDLQDVDYEVVGYLSDNRIVIKVSGDAGIILSDEDKEVISRETVRWDDVEEEEVVEKIDEQYKFRGF